MPAPFRLALYGLVLLIGILVGLEIPLIMRILKREVAFKDLVAQVLTFDYIGALAVVGAVPAAAGAASRPGAQRLAVRAAQCPGRGLGAVAVPGAARRHGRAAGTVRRGHRPARRGFGFAGTFVSLAEANLYNEDIVLGRVQPLPAHRGHALARRAAAVPERQSAVFLGRRVPLPRGAGASRPGLAARRTPRAGAGRR